MVRAGGPNKNFVLFSVNHFSEFSSEFFEEETAERTEALASFIALHSEVNPSIVHQREGGTCNRHRLVQDLFEKSYSQRAIRHLRRVGRASAHDIVLERGRQEDSDGTVPEKGRMRRLPHGYRNRPNQTAISTPTAIPRDH